MDGTGLNVFPDLPSIQENEQVLGTEHPEAWFSPYLDRPAVPYAHMNNPSPDYWPPMHSSVTDTSHAFVSPPWNLDFAKLQQHWSYPSYGLQASQAVLSPLTSAVPMTYSSSSSSCEDQQSLSPVSSYVSPTSWSPVISRPEMSDAYARSPGSEFDYRRYPAYEADDYHEKNISRSSISSSFPLGGKANLGIKLEDVQGYPDAYSEESLINNSDAETKSSLPNAFEKSISHISEERKAITKPELDNVPVPLEDQCSAEDTTSLKGLSDSEPSSKTIRCNLPRNTTQKSPKKAKVAKKSKVHGKTKITKVRVSKQKQGGNKITGAATSLVTKGHKCSQCSQVFSNRSALNKHFTNAHTRPFTCTFREYGCTSTFGSKNEWKRHVSSQHLRLGFWRCDMCTCPTSPDGAKGSNSQRSRGKGAKENDEATNNDFNRKDLFTQHLRRMHMPDDYEIMEDKAALSAWLDKTAHRCLLEVRSPPPTSTCGYCAADHGTQTVGAATVTTAAVFQGHAAWEYRMEHVGRHLESGHGQERKWVEDLALRDWMLEQDLIAWYPGGGGGRYALSGNTSGLGRR